MLFHLQFSPDIDQQTEECLEVYSTDTLAEYIPPDFQDYTFQVQIGQRKFIKIDIFQPINTIFNEISIYSQYTSTILISLLLTQYRQDQLKSCSYYPQMLNSPNLSLKSSFILEDSTIFKQKEPLQTNFQNEIQIEGYIIEKLLGEGGFGEVYEVSRNGEFFACKISMHIDELQKEYKIIQSLGQIQLFQFFQSVNFAFFIMEKLFPFEIDNNQQFFLQLAYQIQHLHNNQIIHSDLKVQNILLNAKNEVRIVDFGTATRTDIDEPTWNCTKSHMSPEVKSHTYFGFQTDIWGFGCVCIEVLTKTQMCNILLDKLNFDDFQPYTILFERIFVDFTVRLNIEEIIEELLKVQIK